MSQSGSASKGALRSVVRRARAALTAEQREAAESALTTLLLELLERTAATSVACYLSTPTEPSTRAFVQLALERGVRLLLPVARADGALDWVETTTGWRETQGLLGIGEPEGPRLAASALGTVDLVVVPAAMVDRTGTRLGWGRGYYDRALAAVPRPRHVFALVFSPELIDSLPSEPHDRAMDGVVTPSGIRMFDRTESHTIRRM